MDDLGNEIKNGGAWTSFRQHLSPYYEKSSEGTLFSSSQQIQIMDFLMNDVDVAAMGPQVCKRVVRNECVWMHPPVHVRFRSNAQMHGRGVVDAKGVVRNGQLRPAAASLGRAHRGVLATAPRQEAAMVGRPLGAVLLDEAAN